MPLQVAAQEAKVKAQFIQSLKSPEAKGRMVISLTTPISSTFPPMTWNCRKGSALHTREAESIQVVGAVFSQSAFTYKQERLALIISICARIYQECR